MAVLRIFAPLMGVLTVQIVAASAIQTIGPTPTEYTLAAVGLSTAIVGNVVVTFGLIGLSILYAALPRWVLSREENAYAVELPTLGKYSA